MALLGLTFSTMTAAARCRPEGPPITTEMIQVFISKPTVLLLSDATSQRDADAMEVSVSQYVAADTSALPALVGVLSQASVNQRTAIGRGLYRVVNVCAAVDQAIVQRTETAVRKIGDATVLDAYRTEEAATLGPTTSTNGGDLSAVAGLPAARSLANGPVLDNAMSLKLSDPFVLPEDPRSW